MEQTYNPHAVSLGRQPGGYVVHFSDGKKAFYPDTLLYSILELAAPVDSVDQISNYVFARVRPTGDSCPSIVPNLVKMKNFAHVT